MFVICPYGESLYSKSSRRSTTAVCKIKMLSSQHVPVIVKFNKVINDKVLTIKVKFRIPKLQRKFQELFKLENIELRTW